MDTYLTQIGNLFSLTARQVVAPICHALDNARKVGFAEIRLDARRSIHNVVNGTEAQALRRYVQRLAAIGEVMHIRFAVFVVDRRISR